MCICMYERHIEHERHRKSMKVMLLCFKIFGKNKDKVRKSEERKNSDKIQKFKNSNWKATISENRRNRDIFQKIKLKKKPTLYSKLFLLTVLICFKKNKKKTKCSYNNKIKY